MKQSINEVCENCKGELLKCYEPADTLRGLSIFRCLSCDLLQSLPRIDHQKDRTKRVSSGAAWGNIRYGKVFRNEKSFDFIKSRMKIEDIKSILDIGSSRGYFLKLAKNNLPNLDQSIGVEPDSAIVNKMDDYEDVSIIVDRVENLSFSESSFDLAFSSHTLEHLKNPLKHLIKLHNWLREDGVLFLEVPNTEIIGKDYFEEFFIDKHLYHYTPKTLINTLKLASFDVHQEDISIDNENITVLARKSPLPNSTKTTNINSQKSEELITKYLNFKTKFDKSIKKRIETINEDLKNKNIGFWGAGRILDYFIIKGLDINSCSLVIDKFLSDYMPELHGKKIQKPHDIKHKNLDKIYIFSREYYDEIHNEILLHRNDLDIEGVLN